MQFNTLSRVVFKYLLYARHFPKGFTHTDLFPLITALGRGTEGQRDESLAQGHSPKRLALD